jgi:hypothetical protein
MDFISIYHASYASFGQQPVKMQPYGVVPAVNEFCIEHDWGFAYLTLPDHLYCDVAARKIKRASSDQPQPRSSASSG